VYAALSSQDKRLGVLRMWRTHAHNVEAPRVEHGPGRIKLAT